MIRTHEDFVSHAKRLFALNIELLGSCKNHKKLMKTRLSLTKLVSEYINNAYPERKGNFMLMNSGRPFWPLDPRPEDIFIEDIAHNLGMLCRYSGSVDKFYSVGQHSVLVSQEVSPDAALAGLLHDASEAYVGDVIRPIKHLLTEYNSIEANIMRAVCLRYSIDFYDYDLWREVKRADDVLLTTEFRDAVARCGFRMSIPEQPPLKNRIISFWSPKQSSKQFLKRFEQLCLKNVVSVHGMNPGSGAASSPKVNTSPKICATVSRDTKAAAPSRFASGQTKSGEKSSFSK